jgi:hypothetical protein
MSLAVTITLIAIASALAGFGLGGLVTFYLVMDAHDKAEKDREIP